MSDCKTDYMLLLRRSQKFDFLGLKNLSPVRFSRVPTRTDIIEFITSSCNLKIRRLGAKVCVTFLLF